MEEILKITWRRLFVAFQPKQACDFIVTEGLHFTAKERLVRQIRLTGVESSCELLFRSGTKHHWQRKGGGVRLSAFLIQRRCHGWNQAAGVNVNIANIPMPTAEERAEMRALDAKLDALAAKLKG